VPNSHSINELSPDAPSEAEGLKTLLRLGPLIDSDRNDTLPIHLSDELPVRPSLRDPHGRDLAHEMGYQAAHHDEDRKCRNAFLMSLHETRAAGLQRVHYSRDHNFYAKHRASLPPYWTYLNATRAVDALAERPDLIGHFRVQPQNPRARSYVRQRSCIFAGPNWFDSIAISSDIQPPPSEMTPTDARLILRNAKGEPKAVLRSPLVKKTAKFLACYDQMVERATFTISDPSIRWLSDTVGIVPVKRGYCRIDLDRRHLVRICNGTLNKGGRWYRAFWCEMPKSLRSTLLIDGAPVFEFDFSSCHLRLAYYGADAADALCELGSGDLYVLPGFDPAVWRKSIKFCVQIMLNARSMRAALGATAGMLPDAPWGERLAVAARMISAIKSAHPALNQFWHSGCGRGLQFCDSEIIRLCLNDLMDRAVLGLPIHDSIVVAHEHRDLLIGIMERRFHVDGARLARKRFTYLRRRAGLCGSRLTIGGRGVIGTGDDGTIDPHGRTLSTRDNGRRSLAVLPCREISNLSCLDAEVLSKAPVLQDLALVVQTRRWWPGGLIRAALLTFHAAAQDQLNSIDAFRVWSSRLAADIGLPLPDAEVEAEVQRFLGRRPQRIEPEAIARLCGVSTSEAASLGLRVVRPVRRLVEVPNDAKRAKRMSAGTVPRIVDIEAARPWRAAGLSRAKWFATHDAMSRQVLAYQALQLSGNQEALQHAKSGIEAARRIRALSSDHGGLPVDDLLHRLNAASRRHTEQATWTPKYFIIQPRQGSKSKALVDLITQLSLGVSLHGSVKICSDWRDWPSAEGVNGD
jgi:hypothetical protein